MGILIANDVSVRCTGAFVRHWWSLEELKCRLRTALMPLHRWRSHDDDIFGVTRIVLFSFLTAACIPHPWPESLTGDRRVRIGVKSAPLNWRQPLHNASLVFAPEKGRHYKVACQVYAMSRPQIADMGTLCCLDAASVCKLEGCPSHLCGKKQQDDFMLNFRISWMCNLTASCFREPRKYVY